MGSEKQDEALEVVRSLADRAAAELGLEVVELSLRGGGKRSLLRIDIDRVGPIAVGIDECRKMSGIMGEMLDAADPIPHGYTLEVSSPGIDRPIVTDADVRRNTGRRVIVQTSAPIAGRREFRGILLGSDAGDRVIREDEQEIRIAQESIVKLRQDPGF